MEELSDRKPEPGETNEIIDILLDFIQNSQVNIFELGDNSK